jgi:hypothetical protein
MLTITGRNANENWALFHRLIGVGALVREVSPRGVATKELIAPVATTYFRPAECVLTDPVRDCNPFFHVYEALWMLAGREDVARPKYYSPQIAAYSDDAETFNGAYGYRWRSYFEGDQLIELIRLLKQDPDTRRAVLSMWDGAADLYSGLVGSKDVPCNTHAYFKIREGQLHMTVCNRSNDAVWGCYGANAVHFSILQQFLAAAVEAEVGHYTQVSDSLHVYLEGKAGEVWQRCAGAPPPLLQNYEQEGHGPLVHTWEAFLEESEALTAPADGTPGAYDYTEPWIRNVALPLCLAHEMYRRGELTEALRFLEDTKQSSPHPWINAGVAWLGRRVSARGIER